MNQVEHQGEVYLWVEREWLTADFQTPPQVFVRELERLYGREVDGRKEKRSGKKGSGRPTLSIQSQIAPVIVDLIHKQFGKTGTFVTRGEIIEGLVAVPDIHDLLREVHDRQKGFDSFEEYVGNQVDFFSRGITEGASDFVGLIERVMFDDKWAYRPVADD